MANFPAKAIQHATVDYSQIDSLQQIRPPYPAYGSADWWALRKRLEELIAKDQRLSKIKWTPEQFIRSRNATLASLDDEQGILAYERNGFTREQWLKAWPGRSTTAMLDPGQTLKDIPK